MFEQLLIVARTPKLRTHARTRKSEPAFDAEYGLDGLYGVVSVNLAGSLAAVGADEDIADLAQTDAFDDDLRRSHHEGMDPVGDEVGTPVLRINGMSLFGPVISPAPKGEEAGSLFDGVEKVTAYPGFFELKRTRTVGPILD